MNMIEIRDLRVITLFPFLAFIILYLTSVRRTKGYVNVKLDLETSIFAAYTN